MELPDQFSFSKKPIAPNGKRLSVISATLPDSSNSKRMSTSSSGSNLSRASSLTNQIQRTGRTFSQAENLIEELPSDNPLLDYNEQIRAPKFAVASKKSQDDIGNVSENFCTDEESRLQAGRTRGHHSDSPSPDSPSSLADDPLSMLSSAEGKNSSEKNNAKDEEGKSKYQPAKVALSSNTYGVSPAPSTSHTNYTLSHYMTSMNVISNLETTEPRTNTTTTTTTNANDNTNTDVSTTTSPLSSKKNSDDSIVMLTSKKAPRFALTPVKPMDDPKTPNYIPCVLRPLDQFPQQPHSTGLEDLSLASDSSNDISREHWKPNGSSSACFDCGKMFTLMNRRHHCRKCGEIFCGQCLLSKAKLSFNCEFDLNGIMCKVCFQCGKEWGSFLVESFKVDMMPDFKGNGQKDKKNMMADLDLPQDKKQREITNVPADWSWSSF